jgi:hypothetical protein
MLNTDVLKILTIRAEIVEKQRNHSQLSDCLVFLNPKTFQVWIKISNIRKKATETAGLNIVAKLHTVQNWIRKQHARYFISR